MCILELSPVWNFVPVHVWVLLVSKFDNGVSVCFDTTSFSSSCSYSLAMKYWLTHSTTPHYSYIKAISYDQECECNMGFTQHFNRK